MPELRTFVPEQLIPWPGLNPRRHFDEGKLQELVESVRQRGIHQPVLVHLRDELPHWIVAGERRWRAATIAAGADIPAIARVYTEDEALEIALIENLDRDDLTPVEEARGFAALLARPDMTQRKLAEKIGRTQPYISNRIRLLELPEEVLALIESGRLEVSHARDVLLPFSKIPEEKRRKLFAKVVNEVRKTDGGLDLRTLENIVGDVAANLSRPIDARFMLHGIDKAAPQFTPKAHEKCPCGGPRVRHWHRDQPRCFDETWWTAAQQAAVERRRAAEKRAAEKLAETGASAVPVLTEKQLDKHETNGRMLPTLSCYDAVDATVLADARFAVVKRHTRHEVVCLDEKAYRKAKSAVTRERNRIVAETKEKRAAALRKKAAKSELEPWMLAELLCQRVYDDGIQSIAREVGISIEKPKSPGYDWFDRALRKLPPDDVTLLVKAIAIRMKDRDPHGHELSRKVDERMRKKFAPGVTALKKKLLAAAGIDSKEKPEATPEAVVEEGVAEVLLHRVWMH